MMRPCARKTAAVERAAAAAPRPCARVVLANPASPSRHCSGDRLGLLFKSPFVGGLAAKELSPGGAIYSRMTERRAKKAPVPAAGRAPALAEERAATMRQRAAMMKGGPKSQAVRTLLGGP